MFRISAAPAAPVPSLDRSQWAERSSIWKEGWADNWWTRHRFDGDPPQSADVQAYLKGHNDARAGHGAAELAWSGDLAAKAQEWASGCQFKHSRGSLGPYGENLAAGTGTSTIPAAMKLWVDEASQYDPSIPQASHFTQVVWKSTTQVGCAVAQCDGIFDAKFGPASYYVCEYSPAGNVIGQFPENIQA